MNIFPLSYLPSNVTQTRQILLLGCPWGQRPIKTEITFVYVKQRQNGGRNFHSYSPFNGAGFCGEGKDYFRSSGEHTWKSIWNEHKIIAWSYWPYIYAEWLSKYTVQYPMRINAEPMPFKRSPREELQLFVGALRVLIKKQKNTVIRQSVSRKKSLSHLLYGICVKIFIMNQYISKSYTTSSLRSWRYCVGARLKFWRRSRVPKQGSRDEAVFLAASSTILQRLRRHISTDYYTIPPATQARKKLILPR